MKKGLVIGLNPQRIKKICNRKVQKMITLGDGFIAFLMNAVEDEEIQIANAHFQSTITDISGFLADHDFKPVPIESLELIEERLRVHNVKVVDMVIPFRIPPNRGHYLKLDRQSMRYKKTQLVIQNLHIQGDEFIVVAMDPMWEYGEG